MFALTKEMVSWLSILQTILVLLATKAKYMKSNETCNEVIWIERLMEELVHKKQNTFVYCGS